MTSADEWTMAFDLSWNNITSNQAPGLNSYEKSYYLTKAQNELVKNWYLTTSKGNNTASGFDGDALKQMDFSNLIVTDAQAYNSKGVPSIDPRALVFGMPSDTTVIAIINEQVGLAKDTITNIKNVATLRQVVPVSYDEYLRLMSKPFKEPLKWQAWRILSNGNAEIILPSTDTKAYKGLLYIIRYVKKPYPIILEDLANYGTDITLEGEAGPQDPVCELSASTHEAILQRAVELAKIAWEGDINQTQLHMTAGQRTD